MRPHPEDHEHPTDWHFAAEILAMLAAVLIVLLLALLIEAA